MSRRHTPTPPFVAPRAYVDPVDDAETALGLLRLAVQHPLRHETLVLPLDHDSRGGTIISVTGADHPDDVVEIVDRLCRLAHELPAVCSLVVATVRPTGGDDGDDARRWIQAGDAADDHGIELVEWFVIGPHGVERPREAAGDLERW